MNKRKLIFGTVSALSILVFAAITIIALVQHEGYSVLNSFVSELSRYNDGYLGASAALLFNIALVAGGILMSAFFVGYGLGKSSPLYTAMSFFGILTGVLTAAQGVFTLNVASIHYVMTILLFASAFVTCALYIVASLLTKNFKEASLAGLLVALAAAITSAVFAFFVQFGNMPYILSVRYAIRIKFIPFAVVEWAALLLIFAFAGLLSAKMIISAFKDEDIEYSSKPKIKTSGKPKVKATDKPKIKATGLKFKQNSRDMEL